MPAINLIDAHCHLDFDAFEHDRSAVLQRAVENGISDIVIPGTKKNYWERIRILCANNTPGQPKLHACYGLHPYWTNEHGKNDTEALAQYIAKNRPVAIGECGLDFRPQQADKKSQIYFFEKQLAIAVNNQLPVVIHSVKATETVIQVIKKFDGLSGMIHSYSGSVEQAKQLIELNFFISIGGSVTYENAKSIRKVAREIPLHSLLIETDAPDQPGLKNRGQRNEPAYLVNTLEAISSLREEPPQIIARQTASNTRSLLDI
jgi:TatD DNase family protein